MTFRSLLVKTLRLFSRAFKAGLGRHQIVEAIILLCTAVDQVFVVFGLFVFFFIFHGS